MEDASEQVVRQRGLWFEELTVGARYVTHPDAPSARPTTPSSARSR